MVPLSNWLVPVGLLEVDKGSCPAVRLLLKWLPVLIFSKLAESSGEFEAYLDRSQYWYFPYWYRQCERGHPIVRNHT